MHFFAYFSAQIVSVCLLIFQHKKGPFVCLFSAQKGSVCMLIFLYKKGVFCLSRFEFSRLVHSSSKYVHLIHSLLCRKEFNRMNENLLKEGNGIWGCVCVTKSANKSQLSGFAVVYITRPKPICNNRRMPLGTNHIKQTFSNIYFH